MSTEEVALPAKEEKTPVTEAEKIAQAVKAERFRLVYLLFQNSTQMVFDYRHTIKHNGGLLTKSMGYAYSKGINDVIKLLTKELKDEESVQKE